MTALNVACFTGASVACLIFMVFMLSDVFNGNGLVRKLIDFLCDIVEYVISKFLPGGYNPDFDGLFWIITFPFVFIPFWTATLGYVVEEFFPSSSAADVTLQIVKLSYIVGAILLVVYSFFYIIKEKINKSRYTKAYKNKSPKEITYIPENIPCDENGFIEFSKITEKQSIIRETEWYKNYEKVINRKEYYNIP